MSFNLTKGLTKEKVENSTEFKLLRSLLKHRLPFIVDIVANDDPETYGSLIFFDIIVDYNKLVEYFGEDKIEGLTKQVMDPKFLPWENYEHVGVSFKRFLNDESLGDKVNGDVSKIIHRFNEHVNIPEDKKLPAHLSRSVFRIRPAHYKVEK
jgi:hypothetical protein